MNPKAIQVVDLFAGPGGLGEGFSAFEDKFKILVSAEMETSAHKTLTLRSYFRNLKSYAPEFANDYYDFCNSYSPKPYKKRTEELWELAKLEARQITLGTKHGNKELDLKIELELDATRHWVLIGGPPCQAYSLVGRARNRGIEGYSADKDQRHFLYKEYLRIIARYKPAAFVMENVKGILSATVSGRRIFHDILEDLSFPNSAIAGDRDVEGEKYVICSLATGATFRYGDSAAKFDAKEFIIRAERFGIPQARHRVILLGIKESLYRKFATLSERHSVSVEDVLTDLPHLRSRLSRSQDSSEAWHSVVLSSIDSLVEELAVSDPNLYALRVELAAIKTKIRPDLQLGKLQLQQPVNKCHPSKLAEWFVDPLLEVCLNHEARGHMESDLKRYIYASVYAKHFGQSPKGAKGFALPSLAPNHKNWESGKFADRFRAQLSDHPSTTITSHISKDGHYFIHPDPTQCRSFTVREAARLQTFPDNYFFQGNRTQQFHQVGNAVPPLLAYQIAGILNSIFDDR